VPTGNCIDANSGAIQELEAQMKVGTKNITNITSNASTREIEDSGRVQMGAASSGFPPALGTPPEITEGGRVKLGAVSPSFPPIR